MNVTSDRKLRNDIVWYMIGTALPMLTLFVRSPIYTRIYSPELYGVYTIAYITFTYLSTISYQWITNNVWRYFLKYRNTNTLGLYWSVTFYLLFVSAILVAVICTVWFLLSDDPVLKQLIVLGGLYFFTNEFVNILLIPSRISGKAGYYNILNSVRAVCSFLLLLGLTFIGHAKIEAFFTAPLMINVVFIIFLIKSPVSYFSFRVNRKLIRHARRFVKYGLGNLFFSMGLFLLVSGDRYLIAYFSDYDHVGIYNQTYNIGQLSIVALFTVISAALNPSLISELNKKPFDSDQKLYDYLYISVYLILPLTFLFSLFSKEITRILLGKDFREAWNILPLIFFSAFFSGANHFAVIKIKFTNKLRLLIIDSISAAALNIVLNLILIPLYGYKIAAATTFIAYVYLFIILFYHAGLNPFANRETGRKLVRIILILTGLFGVHLAIKHFISGPTLVLPIAETIIFVLIYYILTRKIVPLKGEQI